jgi:hypothetical protein
MTTTFELAVVADPTLRWAGLLPPPSPHPPSPETLSRVPDDPESDFFDELDDSSDLAQSPPEEVEQIEEEVDEADIREYLAMQARRDSALVEEDTAEMDLHGLDRIDQKTSAGKEGDAQSTKRVYSRINRFYVRFLAEVDSHDDVLVSKDLYLLNKADHVNRKLVRFFITWYIHETSPTTSHVAEALMFLQHKLSDATNGVGFIPRKG